MHDKRQSPRVNVEGSAWLKIADSWHGVELVNLSRFGVGLNVDKSTWLKVADRLDVVGRVEAHGLVCRFRGQVAWSSRQGDQTVIGISVEVFDEGDLRSLIQAHNLTDVDTSPEFRID